MFRQILRFGIVGLGATTSDAILYYALSAGGMEVHAAKGLSYGIGVIIGFLGNTTWVFRTTRPIASVSFPYVALYAVTLGINVVLNGVALHLVSLVFPHAVAKGLAFLAATGITTIVNFLGCSLLLSPSKRLGATWPANLAHRRALKTRGADATPLATQRADATLLTERCKGAMVMLEEGFSVGV